MENLVNQSQLRDYLKKSSELAEQIKNHELAIKLTHDYHQIEHKVREEFMTYESALTDLRQRRLNLMDERRLQFFKDHAIDQYELDHFQLLLSGFASWQYPALNLYPGTGELLQFLVSAEPLYVADTDMTVLNHCNNHFNEFFADRRLLKYLITEHNFSSLPQGAFGLVTSIHWTPFENTKGLTNILEQTLKLLLPGGVFIFSYNPLDHWWGMAQMTKGLGYGIYTDELLNLANLIGFEILKVNVQHRRMTYVICKKPGNLDSAKLSSIVAKIIAVRAEIF